MDGSKIMTNVFGAFLHFNALDF